MYFPAQVRAPVGIEAPDPDAFAEDLFDVHPTAVVDAASRQRAAWVTPTMEGDRYPDN